MEGVNINNELLSQKKTMSRPNMILAAAMSIMGKLLPGDHIHYESETTLFSQNNDDKEYQLWKASAKRWRKNERRAAIVKLGGYVNTSRVLRFSPV